METSAANATTETTDLQDQHQEQQAPQTPSNILAGAKPAETLTLAERLPEKFRSVNEAGELDLEGSTAKLLESYKYLEKRQGSGEAPPKSHEDYSVALEIEGFNWDEYKADPMTAQFLEGAHAAGLNNQQVQFVIGKYMEAAPQLMQAFTQLDADDAMANLRETWRSDDVLNANLQAAYRATMSFDAGEELLEKYGNDPDFIRFAASFGSQMREDNPPPAMQMIPQADFDTQIAELRDKLGSLPAHDSRRGQTLQQISALYEKRFGNAPAHGLG